jgi:ribosome biogenesis protein MAK21
MAKPSKKGKGPRRSLNGSGLDEKSLDKLTSSIDKKLTSNDHKRKQPPTKAAGDQHQKRQRNSEGSVSDKKGSKIDNKTLLEEIKSLGGDERDLELIQDIDSEDEAFVQDSKAVDKSLKDELAAFSKQLGFEEVEVSEASDDEEEAEEAEDDDEEDGDEDEDEDEDEEDEEDEEETKDVIPKKVGNLVS